MSLTNNILNVPELSKDDCMFCRPKKKETLASNDLAMLLTDTYPVVDGHCLIVPRRHAPTLFDLTPEEMTGIYDMAQQGRMILTKDDPTISGFNLGVNAGSSAGQSVFHCHFHLFPRRDGDQENPRGGVRRIFPDKALYKRKTK
jgi:ATP adenylyltransferase